MSDARVTTCEHATATQVVPPAQLQAVYKDECTLCFDSPVRLC